MTDIEIIAGLKKGDKRSYETLYHEFYNRIRFFADQFVNDLDAAHEITIEAFIKLWQKRNDFETVYNIKAFLFITTKNACLNHIKHLKRRKLAHDEILYVTEKESDYIMDDAIAADTLSHIFRESHSLSRTCRRIVQLHYVEGLTYKEIAHQLHISVENVRVQHANAVQALRNLLKKKDLLLLAVICTLMFI
jgi:RNA polymerase sigma-70 factor (ECF subfamily)